jgi:hypothetical protein
MPMDADLRDFIIAQARADFRTLAAQVRAMLYQAMTASRIKESANG